MVDSTGTAAPLIYGTIDSITKAAIAANNGTNVKKDPFANADSASKYVKDRINLVNTAIEYNSKNMRLSVDKLQEQGDPRDALFNREMDNLNTTIKGISDKVDVIVNDNKGKFSSNGLKASLLEKKIEIGDYISQNKGQFPTFGINQPVDDTRKFINSRLETLAQLSDKVDLLIAKGEGSVSPVVMGNLVALKEALKTQIAEISGLFSSNKDLSKDTTRDSIITNMLITRKLSELTSQKAKDVEAGNAGKWINVDIKARAASEVSTYLDNLAKQRNKDSVAQFTPVLNEMAEKHFLIAVIRDSAGNVVSGIINKKKFEFFSTELELFGKLSPADQLKLTGIIKNMNSYTDWSSVGPVKMARDTNEIYGDFMELVYMPQYREKVINSMGGLEGLQQLIEWSLYSEDYNSTDPGAAATKAMRYIDAASLLIQIPSMAKDPTARKELTDKYTRQADSIIKEMEDFIKVTKNKWPNKSEAEKRELITDLDVLEFKLAKTKIKVALAKAKVLLTLDHKLPQVNAQAYQQCIREVKENYANVKAMREGPNFGTTLTSYSKWFHKAAIPSDEVNILSRLELNSAFLADTLDLADMALVMNNKKAAGEYLTQADKVFKSIRGVDDAWKDLLARNRDTTKYFAADIEMMDTFKIQNSAKYTDLKAKLEMLDPNAADKAKKEVAVKTPSLETINTQIKALNSQIHSVKEDRVKISATDEREIFRNESTLQTLQRQQKELLTAAVYILNAAANDSVLMGNFDDARKYSKDALYILQGASRVPGYTGQYKDFVADGDYKKLSALFDPTLSEYNRIQIDINKTDLGYQTEQSIRDLRSAMGASDHGRVAQAISGLEKIKSVAEDKTGIDTSIAQAYMDGKRFDEARVLYQKILSTPNVKEHLKAIAYLNIARIELSAEHYPEAISLFEHSIAGFDKTLDVDLSLAKRKELMGYALVNMARAYENNNKNTNFEAALVIADLVQGEILPKGGVLVGMNPQAVLHLEQYAKNSGNTNLLPYAKAFVSDIAKKKEKEQTEAEAVNIEKMKAQQLKLHGELTQAKEQAANAKTDIERSVLQEKVNVLDLKETQLKRYFAEAVPVALNLGSVSSRLESFSKGLLDSKKILELIQNVDSGNEQIWRSKENAPAHKLVMTVLSQLGYQDNGKKLWGNDENLRGNVLAAFQKDHGLIPDGKLDGTTLMVLLSVFEANDAKQADKVQQALPVAAKVAPPSINTKEVLELIQKIDAGKVKIWQSKEDTPAHKLIMTMLNELGYPDNGTKLWGTDSDLKKNVLFNFQNAQGLPATGKLDGETIRVLLKLYDAKITNNNEKSQQTEASRNVEAEQNFLDSKTVAKSTVLEKVPEIKGRLAEYFLDPNAEILTFIPNIETNIAMSSLSEKGQKDLLVILQQPDTALPATALFQKNAHLITDGLRARHDKVLAELEATNKLLDADSSTRNKNILSMNLSDLKDLKDKVIDWSTTPVGSKTRSQQNVDLHIEKAKQLKKELKEIHEQNALVLKENLKEINLVISNKPDKELQVFPMTSKVVKQETPEYFDPKTTNKASNPESHHSSKNNYDKIAEQLSSPGLSATDIKHYLVGITSGQIKSWKTGDAKLEELITKMIQSVYPDLKGSAGTSIVSDPLKDNIVSQFQAKHHLTQDGKLGKSSMGILVGEYQKQNGLIDTAESSAVLSNVSSLKTFPHTGPQIIAAGTEAGIDKKLYELDLALAKYQDVKQSIASQGYVDKNNKPLFPKPALDNAGLYQQYYYTLYNIANIQRAKGDIAGALKLFNSLADYVGELGKNLSALSSTELDPKAINMLKADVALQQAELQLLMFNYPAANAIAVAVLKDPATPEERKAGASLIKARVFQSQGKFSDAIDELKNVSFAGINLDDKKAVNTSLIYRILVAFQLGEFYRAQKNNGTIQKLAVLEKVPEIKDKLIEYFIDPKSEKLRFKPNSEESIIKSSLSESGKKELLSLLKQSNSGIAADEEYDKALNLIKDNKAILTQANAPHVLELTTHMMQSLLKRDGGDYPKAMEILETAQPKVSPDAPLSEQTATRYWNDIEQRLMTIKADLTLEKQDINGALHMYDQVLAKKPDLTNTNTVDAHFSAALGKARALFEKKDTASLISAMETLDTHVFNMQIDTNNTKNKQELDKAKIEALFVKAAILLELTGTDTVLKYAPSGDAILEAKNIMKKIKEEIEAHPTEQKNFERKLRVANLLSRAALIEGNIDEFRNQLKVIKDFNSTKPDNERDRRFVAMAVTENELDLARYLQQTLTDASRKHEAKAVYFEEARKLLLGVIKKEFADGTVSGYKQGYDSLKFLAMLYRQFDIKSVDVNVNTLDDLRKNKRNTGYYEEAKIITDFYVDGKASPKIADLLGIPLEQLADVTKQANAFKVPSDIEKIEARSIHNSVDNNNHSSAVTDVPLSFAKKTDFDSYVNTAMINLQDLYISAKSDKSKWKLFDVEIAKLLETMKNNPQYRPNILAVIYFRQIRLESFYYANNYSKFMEEATKLSQFLLNNTSASTFDWFPAVSRFMEMLSTVQQRNTTEDKALKGLLQKIAQEMFQRAPDQFYKWISKDIIPQDVSGTKSGANITRDLALDQANRITGGQDPSTFSRVGTMVEDSGLKSRPQGSSRLGIGMYGQGSDKERAESYYNLMHNLGLLSQATYEEVAVQKHAVQFVDKENSFMYTAGMERDLMRVNMLAQAQEAKNKNKQSGQNINIYNGDELDSVIKVSAAMKDEQAKAELHSSMQEYIKATSNMTGATESLTPITPTNNSFRTDQDMPLQRTLAMGEYGTIVARVLAKRGYELRQGDVVTLQNTQITVNNVNGIETYSDARYALVHGKKDIIVNHDTDFDVAWIKSLENTMVRGTVAAGIAGDSQQKKVYLTYNKNWGRGYFTFSVTKEIENQRTPGQLATTFLGAASINIGEEVAGKSDSIKASWSLSSPTSKARLGYVMTDKNDGRVVQFGIDAANNDYTTSGKLIEGFGAGIYANVKQNVGTNGVLIADASTINEGSLKVDLKFHENGFSFTPISAEYNKFDQMRFGGTVGFSMSGRQMADMLGLAPKDFNEFPNPDKHLSPELQFKLAEAHMRSMGNKGDANLQLAKDKQFVDDLNKHRQSFLDHLRIFAVVSAGYITAENQVKLAASLGLQYKDGKLWFKEGDPTIKEFEKEYGSKINKVREDGYLLYNVNFDVNIFDQRGFSFNAGIAALGSKQLTDDLRAEFMTEFSLLNQFVEVYIDYKKPGSQYGVGAGINFGRMASIVVGASRETDNGAETYSGKLSMNGLGVRMEDNLFGGTVTDVRIDPMGVMAGKFPIAYNVFQKAGVQIVVNGEKLSMLGDQYKTLAADPQLSEQFLNVKEELERSGISLIGDNGMQKFFQDQDRDKTLALLTDIAKNKEKYKLQGITQIVLTTNSFWANLFGTGEDINKSGQMLIIPFSKADKPLNELQHDIMNASTSALNSGTIPFDQYIAKGSEDLKKAYNALQVAFPGINLQVKSNAKFQEPDLIAFLDVLKNKFNAENLYGHNLILGANENQELDIINADDGRTVTIEEPLMQKLRGINTHISNLQKDQLDINALRQEQSYAGNAVFAKSAENLINIQETIGTLFDKYGVTVIVDKDLRQSLITEQGIQELNAILNQIKKQFEKGMKMENAGSLLAVHITNNPPASTMPGVAAISMKTYSSKADVTASIDDGARAEYVTDTIKGSLFQQLQPLFENLYGGKKSIPIATGQIIGIQKSTMNYIIRENIVDNGSNVELHVGGYDLGHDTANSKPKVYEFVFRFEKDSQNKDRFNNLTVTVIPKNEDGSNKNTTNIPISLDKFNASHEASGLGLAFFGAEGKDVTATGQEQAKYIEGIIHKFMKKWDSTPKKVNAN